MKCSNPFCAQVAHVQTTIGRDVGYYCNLCYAAILCMAKHIPTAIHVEPTAFSISNVWSYPALFFEKVKWQDTLGGWHTGSRINGAMSSEYPSHVLVKESCDGKLTWVKQDLLQKWAGRDEWEKEPTT